MPVFSLIRPRLGGRPQNMSALGRQLPSYVATFVDFHFYSFIHFFIVEIYDRWTSLIWA